MKTYAAFDAEIFSVGTWNGDKFTGEDLDQMVNNFALLKNDIKPPVKLGHTSKLNKEVDEGQPAFGWVQGLKRVGDKLIASFKDVPEILMDAIKKGLYKRVSAEIYYNVKHGGKNIGKVLSGVALLGSAIPAVKNLKDLTAYLSETPDLSIEFDGEGVYVFTEVSAEITEKGSDNMSTEIKLAELEKKFSELEAQTASREKELSTELEAKDKQLKEFQEARDKEVKELAEEKQKTSLEEVKAFCEAAVKEGKMTPASAEVITKAIEEKRHEFSEKNEAVFTWGVVKEFAEAIGKTMKFDEKGTTEGGEPETAGETLVSEIRKYADEHKLTYGEASNKLRELKPHLFKEHEAEIEGGV